jgi:two-component system nitrogen regulation response regulator GlnG
MALLLAVDDDPSILDLLTTQLQSDSLAVRTAASAEQGIDAVRGQRPDVLVLDLYLPEGSGLELLAQIHAVDQHLPVIIFTAYPEVDAAAEATARGAFAFLEKPWGVFQLPRVVDEALEAGRLHHLTPVCDPAGSPGHPEGRDAVVGRSGPMLEVSRLIGRAAPQDVTVLLLGESGTGKELAAQALHRHGRRRDGPFLTHNCAAGPETLLESELFGHEKGSFTGADRQRSGKFELANHGSLFLDEVGELSPAGQAKLLRVLQERSFERVGGDETIHTDVRLIAATNQDLEALVKDRRFRPDLLYRLNACTIRLPPLRERGADLPLLIDHFLRVFSRAFGKVVPIVEEDAMRLLEAHSWPGNVRELQNVIQYALLQTPGGVLTASCLPEGLRQRRGTTTAPASSTGEETSARRASEGTTAVSGTPDLVEWVRALLQAGGPKLYHKACALMDGVLLTEALRLTGGNQVQASTLLGLSRSTLRDKLDRLDKLKPDNSQPACTESGQPCTDSGQACPDFGQG